MRHVPTVIEPNVLKPAEIEALVATLAAACASDPIELLYLHGAHARGTLGTLSDLDLAVLDKPSTCSGERHGEHLAMFQTASGREDLDLVILNTAGPMIRDRAVHHGRLVYAHSELQRIQFKARTIM